MKQDKPQTVTDMFREALHDKPRLRRNVAIGGVAAVIAVGLYVHYEKADGNSDFEPQSVQEVAPVHPSLAPANE